MSKLKSSGKVPDESCEDDDQCGAHKRCRNKVCVEGEKEMVTLRHSKPRIFPGGVKPIVKATIGATAQIIKLIAALVTKFKLKDTNNNNTPDYRLFMPVKTCGTDQDCRTGERCQQGICESIPGHVRLTRVMFGPAVTCEADM